MFIPLLYAFAVQMKIPVSRPDIGDLEKSYVQSALDSGWISSSGLFVDQFQIEWAKECESKYALAVSNGTVALHLILVSLGIGPGDEVIVPSLTFIASANAIMYVGATPVFSDVNPDTWCLSLENIEPLISSRTKAILNVDLYGNPSDLLSLEKFCEEKEIFLIDDAAEAPFATSRDRRVGSFGIASSFSFFGNKIISSGEGGAITTSNKVLWEKMKLLRDQGMDPQRRYFFPEIGFNYRLTNIQCALLCAQLARKDELIGKRNLLYSRYDEAFRNMEFIKHQKVNNFSKRSPWLYTFLVTGSLASKRNEIMRSLALKGIETRPIFIPIHTLPPYSPHASLKLAVTQGISETGISLPTSSTMSASEQEYVIEEFANIYASHI
jgi:perosamine synthetase